MSEIDSSLSRYKLQVVVNCDLICSQENIDEIVTFEISRLAGMKYSCVSYNVNKLKEKPQKQQIAQFSIDDVIPFITISPSEKTYTVGKKSYTVRMNSQRYFVFRDSLSCVSCGIIGSKMILEKHTDDKTAHFNLYAEEEGSLILMTKDHIKAKSVGGKNTHKNYVSMCSVCNNIKADLSITLEQLKILRQTYNANKNVLAKKELSKLIIKNSIEFSKINNMSAVDHVISFEPFVKNIEEPIFLKEF